MTNIKAVEKPKRRSIKGPQVGEGSREAKRLAACILEVLGGMRLPSDAATALSVSLPRYYQLEARALNGLLAACEPRRLGRVRSTESELASATKEIGGSVTIRTIR